MIITIRPQGASAAAEALSAVGIKSRITRAIRRAIKAGKTTGQNLTKSRYVKNINRFGTISSRASGMRGVLKISGSRNLIKRFKVTPSTRPPSNPPGGLFVQIVRGQGGMLPHAFIGKGDVWERTGRQRHKIHKLTTVSLPGGWGRVSAKVEAAIARQLEKNMEAVI